MKNKAGEANNIAVNWSAFIHQFHKYYHAGLKTILHVDWKKSF